MEHPAAWHPDPLGRHQYRYWDGERWSEHVADDGRTSLDPLDRGDPPAGGQADVPDATSPLGPSDAGTDAHDRGTTTGGPTPSPDQPEQRWVPQAAPDGGGPYPRQGQHAGQWGAQSSTASGSSTNGIAVAALVVGILSLLVSFVPVIGLIGVIGGIVALILGIIARGKAKAGAGGSGIAIGGIITGAIAIVVAVLITVAVFAFGRSFMGDSFSNYVECIEETGDEQRCQEQFEDDLLDNLPN